MIQTHGFFGLNFFDYAVIAVIAISALISLVRGFLKEFISLLIWVIGFWVAIKFYGSFGEVLKPYIANDAIRPIASFAGLFLLVLLLGIIFNYFLSFLIVKTGLSGADRLLGMLFGFARGVLLISIVILLVATTSFAQDEWWKNSILIPHFQPIVEWLRTFLPEKITTLAGAIAQTKA